MGALEPGLFSFLSATFGHSRIYPVKLPQDPTYPAVVYEKLNSDVFTGMTMSGASGFSKQTYQISIFDPQYSLARMEAKTLRNAIDGFQGTMGAEVVQAAFWDDDSDEFEDRTKVFRISVDVTIAHKE